MVDSIGIVNYGMGNLTSVKNALNYFGISNQVINHYDQSKNVPNYAGYILSGVGAFGQAMNVINSSFLKSYLNKEIVERHKPVLGICLGFQLLFDKSEETLSVSGLGLIKGDVIKFKHSSKRIPHVGWNNISHDDSELFGNISNGQNFYFDHSYHVDTDLIHSTSTTEYINKFTSSLRYKNIYGVQFHPERSQLNGLEIFRNFSKICRL